MKVKIQISTYFSTQTSNFFFSFHINLISRASCYSLSLSFMIGSGILQHKFFLTVLLLFWYWTFSAVKSVPTHPFSFQLLTLCCYSLVLPILCMYNLEKEKKLVWKSVITAATTAASMPSLWGIYIIIHKIHDLFTWKDLARCLTTFTATVRSPCCFCEHHSFAWEANLSSEDSTELRMIGLRLNPGSASYLMCFSE